MIFCNICCIFAVLYCSMVNRVVVRVAMVLPIVTASIYTREVVDGFVLGCLV